MKSLGLILMLITFAASAAPLREITLALMVEDPTPGILKPTYPMVEAAVELAIKERAAELKKMGLKLSLLRYQMPEDPLQTIPVVKRILEEGSIAGIGLPVSLYASIGARVLQGTDYVMVSPYATSTELIENAPNLLLFSATNAQLAAGVEGFAKKIGKKKPAFIVAWDRPYCQNFYNSFSEEFKNSGKLFKVLEGRSDSQSVAEEVVASNPDVVVIPNFAPTTAPYIKALGKLGFHGPFLASDSWGEDNKGDLMRLTQGLKFEGYTLRQYSKHALSPGAKKVQAKLEKTSKEEFRVIPLMFYDSANYLIDRILEAGPNVTRKKVLELAAAKRTYEGVSTLSCLSNLKCPGQSFTVLRVTERGYAPVSKFSQ
ncbi:MAG: ABC transporter substrate-binding protein [Bdellovibrionaceae bacterium]|nr:ABC transporter substrate-binding protein [Bdellovibrionales bacterium]MCB9254022.1 ABC transporter substrate-binding protein [Pseudobdellovibrionaceae bacterium]